MLVNQRSAYAKAEAIAAKEMRRKALREKKQKLLEESSCCNSDECTTSTTFSESTSLVSCPSSPLLTSRKPSIIGSPKKAGKENSMLRRRQDLEEQADALLQGIRREMKALRQFKVDFQAVIEVHVDRAKARHIAQNRTGALISLRRIKRTQMELLHLDEAMVYLCEQEAKIGNVLKSQSNEKNAMYCKELEDLCKMKISDHVAQVKQMLASTSSSLESMSSTGEKKDCSSSEECSDEDLFQEFASMLSEAAASPSQ